MAPQHHEGEPCPKGCACKLQVKKRFVLDEFAPQLLFCAMCNARYEAEYAAAVAAANRVTDREIDAVTA